MHDIIYYMIVAPILMAICMFLIYGSGKDNITNSDKIEFAFRKGFKILMLVSTIMFVTLTVVFFVLAIYNDKKDMFIGTVFFAIFSFLSCVFYLLTKNKKFIYSNNILYSFNLFGKKKILNMQDVVEAIELPSDGMKLICKDNTQVKIDTQMTNYSKIKDILSSNGISCSDNKGNTMPKGW